MGIECKLPPFRAAYVALHRPRPTKDGKKLLYKSVALYAPGADLTAVRQIAFKALQDKFGADKAMVIAKHPKFKSPFKDQSSLVDDTGALRPGCVAGGIFIDMSNEMKPLVLGPDAKELVDPRDFYSGCMAVAKCEVYAWEHPEGGRGVSFSLLGIQKIAEGDRLGGSGLRAEVGDFQPVVDTASNAKPGGGLSADDIPF